MVTKSDIKLIVCDIDDTLIHKETALPENILYLIEDLRNERIQFTLATGRMPYRAKNFAEMAKLDIPYIANNGSILYQNGKYIFCKKLNAEVLKDLLHEYMEKDPDFTVIFSYDDCERPIVETKWIAARKHKYEGYDNPLGDTPETWNQQVHKVYIVDDNRTGIIGEIAERLLKMGGSYSFFQYQQYSMEIVAKGCSKASGLQQLLNYLKISADHTMVIGDHTNDIEVIELAGMGIAVANAQEEVKQAADYVTKGERATGVEEAVRKFVLHDRR